jgi:SH3-like domain-containing protein
VKTQTFNLRVFLFCAVLLLAAGCGKEQTDTTGEYVYVAAPQVALRDRVAAVYNKVGFVSNGDRVRVLERSSNKRFLRVHADDGKEGWIEQRFLVGQDVYNGFAQLARENAQAASQAKAVTKRLVNLHLQPARDSDALYQLKDATKVELIKRATTPKAGMKALKAQEEAEKDSEEDKKNIADEEPPAEKPVAPAKGAPAKGAPNKASKTAAPVAPNSQLEDWWLVRDQQKHVGWLLGRMLDVDVPLEIAQYAEGQRIVASFVLSEVTVPDPDSPGNEKKIPQSAVLMTEPKDGLPFDFNQMRIFTWNTKRSRYETAFRDRFEGQLPFLISKEDFGREGTLPVFSVRARDANGQPVERKYKMNGVIVRRITQPGETPVSHSRRRK